MRVVLSVSLVCALAGAAAAQVNIGGFKIGPKPKPAQPAPAAGGGQGGQQQPAGPDNRAAYEAWRQVEREHKDRLWRLHDYATNLPKGAISSDQFLRRALSDFKELGKLDDVKKGCAENRYAGERRGEPPVDAKTICPLLADAETVLKKAVRAYALAYGEGSFYDFDRSIEKVEKEKQVYLSRAIEGFDKAEERKQFAGRVKEYFDALGEPVPEELLVKVDERVERMKKIIDAAAAEGKIDRPAGKDAGAERAIAEAVTARHKGVQIKKVWMSDAVWKVKQNNLGIIINRYKDGALLIKAKGADYCIVVPSSVGQAYAGGGKYSAHYEVDDYLSGQPVKCK
jgi:hypothetical protein